MKLTVADVMTRGVVTVDADASLDEALALMDDRNIRHLPVLRDGEFTGMLTDRDLLQATGWLPERIREVYQKGEMRPHVVSDVLAQPHHFTRPGEDAISALTVEAVSTGAGGLAVLEEGRVVGILTETDLLKHYAEAVGATGDPEVRTCMCPNLITIAVDGDLETAAKLARAHAVRHLPVVDPSGIVGMLSDRDLRRALGTGRQGHFPVVELMVPHPTTVDAGAPVSRAVQLMLDGGFSALPVLDAGEPVGMLSTLDVIDLLVDSEG